MPALFFFIINKISIPSNFTISKFLIKGICPYIPDWSIKRKNFYFWKIFFYLLHHKNAESLAEMFGSNKDSSNIEFIIF